MTLTKISTAAIEDNAVTTGKIADGAIVNADINASAAIAGTKVSPDFGSQNITTTGDVTDFGNLTAGTTAAEGASNKVKGIFAGGNDGSITNTINDVTIASTGNATDYGDLTVARAHHGGSSNGHGGL